MSTDVTMADAAHLRRNLRLYPYLMACQSLLFWLPVFFLYFSSVVRPEQVLRLEAIYFLAVVALEVPSGYFSDRLGRRLTLAVSAGASLGACVTFVLFSDYAPFVLAQLLMAAAMAFKSGTDSALLYESLKALRRESEFSPHEGRAQAFAFAALSASALLGGVLAGYDLRIAYVLSGMGALAALLLCGLLIEPRSQPEAGAVLGGVARLGASLKRLRDPTLRWLLVFAVAMTVFEHVPYEFFQPYVQFLLDEVDEGYRQTPPVSGLLVALMMGVAAAASTRAVAVSARVGPGRILLLAVGLELVIIAAMGETLHVAVLGLIILRSVPMALARPIMHALIHDRLPSEIRATYFSLQSLAGRLAFSATLALAAWAIEGTQTLSVDAMQSVLRGFTLGGVAVLPFLVVGAARMGQRHG